MYEMQWLQTWLINFGRIDQMWFESRRNAERQKMCSEIAAQQDRLILALAQLPRNDVQSFFSEALRFSSFYHALPDVKSFARALKETVAVDFGTYIAVYSQTAFGGIRDVRGFAEGIAQGDTINIAKGIGKNIVAFEKGMTIGQAVLFANGIGPGIAKFVLGLGAHAALMPLGFQATMVNHFPRGTMWSPGYSEFEEGLGKHLETFRKTLKSMKLEQVYRQNVQIAIAEASRNDTYDGGY